MKYLSLFLVLFVLSFSSCSKPPEKTEDPAEIEQLRQKHKSMAEREMADG